MATWTHEKIGTLTYHYRDGWFKTVEVPAFADFCYDDGYERQLPQGTFKLTFDSRGEQDTPAGDMIAVAVKILADPARVVAAVCDSLWEDFNGRGPGSLMWWNGSLDDVNNQLAQQKSTLRVRESNDILKVIALGRIGIYAARAGQPLRDPRTGKLIEKADYPYRPARATLHFDAAFEEEHGLGVVTDGVAVCGLDYSLDADFFPSMRVRGR